jgi:hypothetical protein
MILMITTTGRHVKVMALRVTKVGITTRSNTIASRGGREVTRTMKTSPEAGTGRKDMTAVTARDVTRTMMMTAETGEINTGALTIMMNN